MFGFWGQARTDNIQTADDEIASEDQKFKCVHDPLERTEKLEDATTPEKQNKTTAEITTTTYGSNNIGGRVDG
jgi:hypothetical protein